MKKLLVLLMGGMLLASTAMAQTKVDGNGVPIKNGWVMDLNFSVPLLCAVQSQDVATKLDIHTNAGIGGGLTFYWANPKIAGYTMVVAVNAPELILTPRFGSETNIDLIVGGDLGFFDNRLRLGMGYDFGTLAYERSRWIGLLSIGVK